MNHTHRDQSKIKDDLRMLMEEILEQEPCGPIIIRQAMEEAEKRIDWTLPPPIPIKKRQTAS